MILFKSFVKKEYEINKYHKFNYYINIYWKILYYKISKKKNFKTTDVQEIRFLNYPHWSFVKRKMKLKKRKFEKKSFDLESRRP